MSILIVVPIKEDTGRITNDLGQLQGKCDCLLIHQMDSLLQMAGLALRKNAFLFSLFPLDRSAKLQLRLCGDGCEDGGEDVTHDSRNSAQKQNQGFDENDQNTVYQTYQVLFVPCVQSCVLARVFIVLICDAWRTWHGI